MTITRQDAWTEEEDVLLANTVLTHIKEGSTQLAAFEEVGNKLYRTSAACGFRWNSYVRKKMKQEIEVAKKLRKEWKQEKIEKKFNESVKEIEKNIEKEEYEKSAVEFSSVINYLTNMYEKTKKPTAEYTSLLQELENKCFNLERENADLKQKIQKIQKEYITIISVLDKAKELVDKRE